MVNYLSRYGLDYYSPVGQDSQDIIATDPRMFPAPGLAPDRNANLIEQYMPQGLVNWGHGVKNALESARGKPTVVGKTLGLLGLDESGKRAATSWGDAALSTLHFGPDLIDGLIGSAQNVAKYDGGSYLTSPDASDRARAAQYAGDVFNVAGALPVGAAGLGKVTGHSPIESNAAGIFGGRLAKTADHAKLAQAEEMAGKGVPREQIWKDTGWFKGVDGKWRFEIDDSGASYRGPQGARSLADALNHDQLASAYPAIANERVRPLTHQEAGKANGGYDPNKREFILGVPDGTAQPLSSGLHEAQHAVQRTEGFQLGSNEGKALKDAWRQIPGYNEVVAAEEAAWNASPKGLNRFNPFAWERQDRAIADAMRERSQFTKENWHKVGIDAISDAYRRSAGEVEARTVQKRMDMKPDERAARPPWLDYDVPEGQQIVTRMDGSSLYSNSKEASLPGLLSVAGEKQGTSATAGRPSGSGVPSLPLSDPMAGGLPGHTPSSGQPGQGGHTSLLRDPSLEPWIDRLGLVRGRKLTDDIARAARDSSEYAPNSFEKYGIRLTDEPLQVGSTAPESRQWYQDFISEDHPTQGRDAFPDHLEPLGGTSTVGLTFTKNGIAQARRDAEGYSHKNAALVGGDKGWHGQDPGELVIRDPTVIATTPRALGWPPEPLFSNPEEAAPLSLLSQGKDTPQGITDLVKRYGFAGAAAMLGMSADDLMSQAQAQQSQSPALNPLFQR